MQISEILNEESIRFLKADCKHDAMSALCEPESRCLLGTENDLAEAMIAESKVYENSTGRGVVLLVHVNPDFEKDSLILGISSDGIEFDAADGLPSNLFIVLLLREKAMQWKHPLLKKLRKMADNSKTRLALLDATTHIEAMQIVLNWENNFDEKQNEDM